VAKDPAAQVQQLVEPILAAAGLELFDVELTGGVLRISVDRPGGIDMEALGATTHEISEALDDHDPIPTDSYTLEVSSPGLERTLRTPTHFRRFVGTTISVKTKGNVPGERRVQATLDAADHDSITVAGRTIAYSDIERARTVFEWGPAPKPGSGTPRTKKSAKKKAATT
jgi:ribosome maturation factor RimP